GDERRGRRARCQRLPDARPCGGHHQRTYAFGLTAYRPDKNHIITETPFMNRNDGTTTDRDSALDTFAAELAHAAYSVALRHKKRASWIDLGLDLLKALDETVRKLGPAGAPGRQFSCRLALNR